MPSDLTPSSPRPTRVLCADDEPAIREVLRAVFRREGFEVESVSNGMDAWRKLTTEPGHFDLLVTDNEMPQLTGSGLVQMVREAELGLKILVFSASLSAADEEAFRSWQVEAIVPKGSPIDELLSEVRRVLQTGQVVASKRS